MATQPQTGLTYEDLRAFPEDNLRRELIDGELIVTAAPSFRHQRVVLAFARSLGDYEDKSAGIACIAPFDVYLSDSDVVEPDVLFVTADHRDRIESLFIRGAPDIVIEISSPSTRRLELVRKRELYERFGVPEYWYVDLDADRIEVYRLVEGAYASPELLRRGDTLRSALLPGFAAEVDAHLGDPEDQS